MENNLHVRRIYIAMGLFGAALFGAFIALFLASFTLGVFIYLSVVFGMSSVVLLVQRVVPDSAWQKGCFFLCYGGCYCVTLLLTVFFTSYFFIVMGFLTDVENDYITVAQHFGVAIVLLALLVTSVGQLLIMLSIFGQGSELIKANSPDQERLANAEKHGQALFYVLCLSLVEVGLIYLVAVLPQPYSPFYFGLPIPGMFTIVVAIMYTAYQRLSPHGLYFMSGVSSIFIFATSIYLLISTLEVLGRERNLMDAVGFLCFFALVASLICQVCVCMYGIRVARDLPGNVTNDGVIQTEGMSLLFGGWENDDLEAPPVPEGLAAALNGGAGDDDDLLTAAPEASA